MTDVGSVGVVSLATNRYVHHWRRMAQTADVNLFPGRDVVLHVFTDQVDTVREFARDLGRVRVDAISIGDLTWPDAPLQKFRVIAEAAARLDEPLLMHLDADMLIVAPVGDELHPDEWTDGVALVRHPGYRRPSGAQRLRLYARHPGVAARDIYRTARVGAIGTWEESRASQAFVPRDLRKTYVCGATWLGQSDRFLALCRVLAARTDVDADHGQIATWHDESHLNWFAATHPVTILDSDYCYVEGLPSLADIEPRIVAVEKNDDRTR